MEVAYRRDISSVQTDLEIETYLLELIGKLGGKFIFEQPKE